MAFDVPKDVPQIVDTLFYMLLIIFMISRRTDGYRLRFSSPPVSGHHIWVGGDSRAELLHAVAELAQYVIRFCLLLNSVIRAGQLKPDEYCASKNSAWQVFFIHAPRELQIVNMLGNHLPHSFDRSASLPAAIVYHQRHSRHSTFRTLIKNVMTSILQRDPCLRHAAWRRLVPSMIVYKHSTF